jgi:quercetin dioxygenase-like cupin family protein
MSDTTVKKISSRGSPHGEMDQTYLVSGKRVSLRLWRNEKPQKKAATRRDYETVGYVLAGYAELMVEGQTVSLEPGDSWLVPAGAEPPIGLSRNSRQWRQRRLPPRCTAATPSVTVSASERSA